MLERRVILFCLAGAVNTAFGYALFAVLLSAGLHRVAAMLVATAGGVLFNYWFTGRVVFDNRGLGRLPRFVGAYIIVYLINVACMEALVAAGAGAYAAGAVSIAVAAAAAYLIQSRFVFGRTAP
jgi:putative flippase GtrA